MNASLAGAGRQVRPKDVAVAEPARSRCSLLVRRRREVLDPARFLNLAAIDLRPAGAFLQVEVELPEAVGVQPPPCLGQDGHVQPVGVCELPLGVVLRRRLSLRVGLHCFLLCNVHADMRPRPPAFDKPYSFDLSRFYAVTSVERNVTYDN